MSKDVDALLEGTDLLSLRDRGIARIVYEDARRLGFIRRTFDVEAWFDRRFLERAVDAAGLRGFWPEHDTAGVRRPKTDKS